MKFTKIFQSLAIAAAALTFVLSAGAQGRIQKREEHQQARIANGIKNGSLTAGETARLEHREAGLNRQIHHERVANGGHLTAGERAQVNREQNHISRNIYRDKHNARHQP
ncbi:MAG: hypothetical protein ACLP1Y_01750 [Candidatus Acidiferrales bacterium]